MTCLVLSLHPPCARKWLLLAAASAAMAAAAEVPQSAAVNAALVQTNILGISLIDGWCTPGKQIPYVSKTGDIIYTSGSAPMVERWVRRGGVPYGVLVKNDTIVKTCDTIANRLSNRALLDAAASYRVCSADDPEAETRRLVEIVAANTAPQP